MRAPVVGDSWYSSLPGKLLEDELNALEGDVHSLVASVSRSREACAVLRKRSLRAGLAWKELLDRCHGHTIFFSASGVVQEAYGAGIRLSEAGQSVGPE